MEYVLKLRCFSTPTPIIFGEYETRYLHTCTGDFNDRSHNELPKHKRKPSGLTWRQVGVGPVLVVVGVGEELAPARLHRHQDDRQDPEFRHRRRLPRPNFWWRGVNVHPNVKTAGFIYKPRYIPTWYSPVVERRFKPVPRPPSDRVIGTPRSGFYRGTGRIIGVRPFGVLRLFSRAPRRRGEAPGGRAKFFGFPLARRDAQECGRRLGGKLPL